MGQIPTPSVPVSWGELLDKMTILEIKQVRITAPAPRRNVCREYELLRLIGTEALEAPAVRIIYRCLKRVNEALWQIEDTIREKEAAQQFDPAFIRLARSVYQMNDRRASLKRDINCLLGSELVEEKSYASISPAELAHHRPPVDLSMARRSP
jgi:hypothetical protein